MWIIAFERHRGCLNILSSLSRKNGTVCGVCVCVYGVMRAVHMWSGVFMVWCLGGGGGGGAVWGVWLHFRVLVICLQKC